MDVQIDTAIKRARGYWFVDGFTEMAAGGLFVLLAGLLLPIFGLLAASLLIASAGSVLSSMPAWFPVGLGLVWAALCVLAGEWMGLRRFRLVGALILLAGMTVGTWQLLLGLPTLPANVQPGILQPPVLESINRTLASQIGR